MQPKFTPLGNNLVILPEKKKDMTEGGLIIPTKAQKETGRGTVVAISAQITQPVEVGDEVLYAVNGVNPLEDGGINYHIINIDHVQLVFNAEKS